MSSSPEKALHRELPCGGREDVFASFVPTFFSLPGFGGIYFMIGKLVGASLEDSVSNSRQS